jgi:hypothetical protein
VRTPYRWTICALLFVVTTITWSANVYTLASDMFPPSAVASVSGIGGFGPAPWATCCSSGSPVGFSTRPEATTHRSEKQVLRAFGAQDDNACFFLFLKASKRLSS